MMKINKALFLFIALTSLGSLPSGAADLQKDFARLRSKEEQLHIKEKCWMMIPESAHIYGLTKEEEFALGLSAVQSEQEIGNERPDLREVLQHMNEKMNKNFIKYCAALESHYFQLPKEAKADYWMDWLNEDDSTLTRRLSLVRQNPDSSAIKPFVLPQECAEAISIKKLCNRVKDPKAYSMCNDFRNSTDWNVLMATGHGITYKPEYDAMVAILMSNLKQLCPNGPWIQ